MMRLYDAVPEIDFTWATITPGDVDSRAGNLEMARITFENSRKHLQDEVRMPDQAPVFIEMLEAIAGAPLRGAPDLVGDQLHHRAAAARRRDDRGAHPHGQGRLPDLRAADAADGHHRADERARHQHPEHGRAAQRRRALPARGARLRAWSRPSARRSAEMRSGLYLAGTPEDGAHQRRSASR